MVSGFFCGLWLGNVGMLCVLYLMIKIGRWKKADS